jgi:hypothetical protein
MKYPMPASAIEIKKHQRADGFTKCLGKSPFREWLRLLLHHDAFVD